MISPKEQVSTEFTKKQPNLAQSFSSLLNRTLGETSHGGSMADVDVSVRKILSKVKRQEIDPYYRMSDKEYTQHLEIEVARLTTKIMWLKPNQDRKLLRYAVRQKEIMDRLKPKSHLGLRRRRALNKQLEDENDMIDGEGKKEVTE